VGKVDWYIDNMGVINNFRKMHRWVANDWSKAGDRDVNGYLNALRNEVKGERAVHHQSAARRTSCWNHRLLGMKLQLWRIHGWGDCGSG
jgi:hypothetical protein